MTIFSNMFLFFVFFMEILKRIFILVQLFSSCLPKTFKNTDYYLASTPSFCNLYWIILLLCWWTFYILQKSLISNHRYLYCKLCTFFFIVQYFGGPYSSKGLQRRCLHRPLSKNTTEPDQLLFLMVIRKSSWLFSDDKNRIPQCII